MLSKDELAASCYVSCYVATHNIEIFLFMTQVEKIESGKNSPFWRWVWLLLTISIKSSHEDGEPCGLSVASFVEKHDSGMLIFVKSQMRKNLSS